SQELGHTHSCTCPRHGALHVPRVHVSVCVCMRAHRVHVSVCVCMRAHRVHVSVCVCMRVHRVHVSVCVCMRVHRVHVSVCVCMRVHRVHVSVCACVRIGCMCLCLHACASGACVCLCVHACTSSACVCMCLHACASGACVCTRPRPRGAAPALGHRWGSLDLGTTAPALTHQHRRQHGAGTPPMPTGRDTGPSLVKGTPASAASHSSRVLPFLMEFLREPVLRGSDAVCSRASMHPSQHPPSPCPVPLRIPGTTQPTPAGPSLHPMEVRAARVPALGCPCVRIPIPSLPSSLTPAGCCQGCG
uniref:Uncharacterized protein n=1 Tax=Amazona collaria TaxID=241587 RepID=A0A8B9F3N7_9PSIT